MFESYEVTNCLAISSGMSVLLGKRVHMEAIFQYFAVSGDLWFMYQWEASSETSF